MELRNSDHIRVTRKLPNEALLKKFRRTQEEQKEIDAFYELERQIQEAQERQDHALARRFQDTQSGHKGLPWNEQQIREIDEKAAAARLQHSGGIPEDVNFKPEILRLVSEVKQAIAAIDETKMADAIFVQSSGPDRVVSLLREHLNCLVIKVCSQSDLFAHLDLEDSADLEVSDHAHSDHVPMEALFQVDYDQLETRIKIGARHEASRYVNKYPLASLWTLIKWPIWRLRKCFSSRFIQVHC